MKKALTLILALCLLLSFGAFAEGKTMVIGDTTFNSENWEETVDPHRTYNGWACIRYGIGGAACASVVCPAIRCVSAQSGSRTCLRG